MTTQITKLAVQVPADLEDREKNAAEAAKALSKRLDKFIDKKARIVVAKSEKDCRDLDEILKDMPKVLEELVKDELTTKTLAGQIYDLMTSKINKYSAPFASADRAIRSAIGLFARAEKLRREELAAEQQKFTTAAVVQPLPLDIGASIAERKKGKVAEGKLLDLVKEIAKGKAPLALIQVVNKEIDAEARREWSGVKIKKASDEERKKGIHGYLYNGSIVLYEQDEVRK